MEIKIYSTVKMKKGDICRLIYRMGSARLAEANIRLAPRLVIFLQKTAASALLNSNKRDDLGEENTKSKRWLFFGGI